MKPKDKKEFWKRIYGVDIYKCTKYTEDIVILNDNSFFGILFGLKKISVDGYTEWIHYEFRYKNTRSLMTDNMLQCAHNRSELLKFECKELIKDDLYWWDNANKYVKKDRLK